MDHIMLVCKYEGERVAMESHSCTSYEKLVQVIRGKWSTLSNEHFDLSYSTPVLEKFLLNDSDDFNCMLRMASIFNMRYVEIEVQSSFANKNRRFEKVGDNSGGVRTYEELAINSQVDNEHSIIVKSSNDTPLLSAYWGMGISHVGQSFPDGRIEFRAALAKYAIDKGFSYSTKRNDTTNFVAHCKYKNEDTESPGCPWFVSASLCRTNNYFIIRKLVNYHTCKYRINREDSKQLSSKIVATLITKPLIGQKRPWAANEVCEYLKDQYGQVIPYSKGWRSLTKANDSIFGTGKESYQKLWWYTRAACELNPGTNIVLELDNETNSFFRIFVAWGACIEGFKFVRPTLFLDGTHLKGKYKGCLLSATGKNANQELYPLAYAIVDSENGDNWQWFLNCLKDVIGHERNITFVSDRNLGLLDALPKVFPESEFFFCMHHLEDNLRGKFNGQAFKGMKERIVTLFKNCAYATTKPEFYISLGQFLQEGGTIAHKFIQDLPYDKWTNAFSRGHRYGEMTSNAAESFNSWIRDARGLPITQCIDKLREKLMMWFNERKEISDALI